MSHMRSDDGGANWWSISVEEYDMASDLLDILHVTTLPWDDFGQYEWTCNDTVRCRGECLN